MGERCEVCKEILDTDTRDEGFRDGTSGALVSLCFCKETWTKYDAVIAHSCETILGKSLAPMSILSW